MGDSATRTQGAAAKGTVELCAGALRLALRADLGGSIAGLWHQDTPILRSTEPDSLARSRQAACYPLVPYSNRLGNKRFRWQGRDHTTETNFDDNPHSVHGVGWLRPWDVVSHSAVEVVLRYRHEPDAHWPFAFEALQKFSLTPHSLSVRMTITNTADIAQPVGLGWHPYFPKRERSQLGIEVSDRWEPDATGLPVRKEAQPGIEGAVAQMGFDHCFDGWVGSASIRDEKFSLRLTSNLSRLVVYTPADKAYFCVEPVSHVSNAIRMSDPAAHGLRTLQPDENFEASMTLEVTAL
jgi:aldose 1-epimerase